MSRPLNALVLGYGFSAKTFHIPFLHYTSGIRLHSILQRPGVTLDLARADYGPGGVEGDRGVKIWGEWEEVVKYQASIMEESGDGGKIDVFIVTVGNEAHTEWVRKGLETGLHVVVEKPFTPTSKECEELIKLAEEKGRVLTVYHNRRLDSDFLTLLSLLGLPSPIQTSMFPTITSSVNPPPLRHLTHLTSSFMRHAPALPHRKIWKRSSTLGNGVLYDLGVHLIDQVLYLSRHYFAPGTRGLPSRVFAILYDERGMWGSASKDREAWGRSWVDDGFEVYLEFPVLTGSPAATGNKRATSTTPENGAQERASNVEDEEVERTITVHLTATSLLPLTPPPRFQVRTFSGSTYIKNGHDVQEPQIMNHICGPNDPAFGVEPENEWGELITVGEEGKRERRKVEAKRGGYVGFYENLVGAITGKGKIMVTGEEAAYAVRVVEACGRKGVGEYIEVQG
ncbi:hypothetical protein BDZ91DRAFT_849736 [Kalaharituber pfeilii]|nr:hypothetical protein BDZ91DRAFT_849736 [Kalaharituber pfeilii]